MRPLLSVWVGFSCICVLLSAPQEAKIPELDDGIALATAAEYDAARQLFLQLLDAEPESPLLNYYVGVCSLFLREEEEARAYLSRAVDLEAAFPEAYYWLAHSFLTEDRFQEARRILEKGLRLFPKNKKLKTLSGEIDSAQAAQTEGE